MTDLRFGVAGYGRWGPNHVRKVQELAGCKIVAVADADAARLKGLELINPEIELLTSAEALVTSPEIDAVIIATPTATHYELVRTALLTGKHVLCEKPVCVYAEEAVELAELAESQGVTLMVGHVFVYNSGILRVKELLDENRCGDLRYLDLVRTNLGPVRRDVDVIHDLAAHDISISNFLMGGVPDRVSATKGEFLQQGVADVAFLHLQYPGNVLANIHVSWLNPKKVRQLTVVGSEQMLTWDEFGNPGPIQVFDRNFIQEDDPYRDFGEFQLKLREGDVYIPRVANVEPLACQAKAFAHAVRTGEPPYSDGLFGADVLRVIEAAHESVAHGGAFCDVRPRHAPPQPVLNAISATA